MAAVPSIPLNNGMKIPAFGLGTWQSSTNEVTDAVKKAIDLGYRLFDCAWIYGNEKEIGLGLRDKIAEGAVRREDLFIVTKLWNIFHHEDKVVDACKVSLNNFGLSYVDCYLMHWPCAQKTVENCDFSSPFDHVINESYDFVKTWKAMEECVKLGLVKSIGLSNFNSEQVKKILKHCTIKPVVNQIEVTPFLDQTKLIKFCKENGIEIMAYSPLASPTRCWLKPDDAVLPLEDARLLQIGKKYGKTGAQVVLRFIYQQGTIPIPKSSNEKRLKENIDIFDFELNADDISILKTFVCGVRVVPADELKDNVDYPFHFIE